MTHDDELKRDAKTAGPGYLSNPVPPFPCPLQQPAAAGVVKPLAVLATVMADTDDPASQGVIFQNALYTMQSLLPEVKTVLFTEDPEWKSKALPPGLMCSTKWTRITLVCRF